MCANAFAEKEASISPQLKALVSRFILYLKCSVSSNKNVFDKQHNSLIYTIFYLWLSFSVYNWHSAHKLRLSFTVYTI